MAKARKLLLLLLMSLSLCLFSGCELWDFIKKKVFERFYPQAEKVSILIVTPYPETTVQLQKQAEDRAFNEANAMRDALIDACKNFNDNSSRTKLDPQIIAGREELIQFYKRDYNGAKQTAANNNVQFRIGAFAREEFLKLRPKYGMSLSCIAFGNYKYDPNATAEVFTFIYYDYKNDSIARKKGVIPKTQGRKRDKAVEDLFTALLKDVYP